MSIKDFCRELLADPDAKAAVSVSAGSLLDNGLWPRDRLSEMSYRLEGAACYAYHVNAWDIGDKLADFSKRALRLMRTDGDPNA